MATLSPESWARTLNFSRLEQRYGLPEGLLTAVVRKESGGDPDIKSKAGALGLFQFMPDTAESYDIDPRDPLQAAPAAAKELGTLYKKYEGNLSQTLAGWNWGQGNVDRQGMGKAPPETRDFISTITGWLSPRSAEASESKRATPVRGSKAERAQPGRSFAAEFLADIEAQGQAPAASKPGASLSPGGSAQQGLVAQPPPSSSAPTGGTQPPLPGAPAPQGVPADRKAQALASLDEMMNYGVPKGGWVGALKTVPPMAVQGGTTALGAAGGAALGGPAGGAVGAGVGSYAGHRLNQAIGQTGVGQALGFPSTPPEVLPSTFDDYLQLAVPMAPLAAPAARQVLRWTRGGRAITAADEATLDALKQYQQEFRAQETQYVQDLEGKFATRRAEIQNARTEAHIKTQEAIDAWETKGGEAYKKAEEAARDAQAQWKAAREGATIKQQQTTQQHGEAVQELQALPDKYQPALPGRTMTDVRADMAKLEAGGAQAEAVVKRLGAQDVAGASAKLADEGNALMQQGQPYAARPGEPIASPTKQPQPS